MRSAQRPIARKSSGWFVGRQGSGRWGEAVQRGVQLRLPTRDSRWRCQAPEEHASGAAPACMAKAASRRNRATPATSARILAAVNTPNPGTGPMVNERDHEPKPHTELTVAR